MKTNRIGVLSPEGDCGKSYFPLAVYTLIVMSLFCRTALSENLLDSMITLDIPTNVRLDDALIEWGLKAQVTVMMDGSMIKHKTTRGLHGTLPARQALSLLLRDSGLSYTQQGNRIHIVPTSALVRSSVQHLQLSTQSDDGSDNVTTTISSAGSEDANEGVSDSVKNKSDIQEIVITGHYQFLSVDTSGATNLPLPIEQVPQSISLVSDDFIKAADLKTLGEIAEYTPGALNVGAPEGLESVIYLRGFAADRAIDGVNVASNAYYEPDYAIFDRLEIVKGPSSVVYGVGTPGGLVNYVTKSATPETIDYLSLQAGSWRNFRLQGQVAGALDADGHVRAIGIIVQDQGDSFLNQVYHKKTSVYGGVNVDFSASIMGYLHGGYERLERPSFDGNPTEADGTPAPLSRSFCICTESIVQTSSVYHSEGGLTWSATDMLEFSVKGNYERASLGGAEDYSQGLMTDGTLTLELEKNVEVLNENYGVGASSIYKFDNLGMKNSFVSLGVLYQNSHSVTDQVFNANGGASNIFDGQAAVSHAFDALLAGPFFPFAVTQNASTLTESAQSVLRLTDPVSVLLGISYSTPKTTVITSGVPQVFNFPGQVSYRSGLTYEFLPKTNAYVSFSQSYSPQSNFEAGNKIAPPLTGNQYEAGLKFRSANGRLLLTGALFQIVENNVSQYDYTSQSGVNYFTDVGKVNHRGLELQVLGQITPEWQINSGYAYLDPKVVGAVATQTATIGQVQLFLPKQTFSTFSTYTLSDGKLRGLSFGGGIRYVSAQPTSYGSQLANAESGYPQAGTKSIPGYVLVDATISYAVDNWLVQLNAHNILDKKYFINNYQTLYYGNMPGDPTEIALSVRRSF
jgi:outer membrane receptor for ferric coprogen and ferric-rhodotorulic acid